MVRLLRDYVLWPCSIEFCVILILRRKIMWIKIALQPTEMISEFLLGNVLLGQELQIDAKHLKLESWLCLQDMLFWKTHKLSQKFKLLPFICVLTVYNNSYWHFAQLPYTISFKLWSAILTVSLHVLFHIGMLTSFWQILLCMYGVERSPTCMWSEIYSEGDFRFFELVCLCKYGHWNIYWVLMFV